MSTQTPDDDTREHAEEPAEGAAPGAADNTPDVREHATEPAEGADDAV